MGILGKALEAEAARRFTLRGVIHRLACGTLLLALGYKVHSGAATDL